MDLIPVFCKKDLNPESWMELGFFLTEGGRSTWKVDSKLSETEIKQLLETNDLPVKKIHKHSNACIVEIDIGKLQLDLFYTWDEINPEVSDLDVWKIIKVPQILWSCSVFRNEFWKSMGFLEKQQDFSCSFSLLFEQLWLEEAPPLLR